MASNHKESIDARQATISPKYTGTKPLPTITFASSPNCNEGSAKHYYF